VLVITTNRADVVLHIALRSTSGKISTTSKDGAPKLVNINEELVSQARRPTSSSQAVHVNFDNVSEQLVLHCDWIISVVSDGRLPMRMKAK
jgi:hypothetical protein